MSMLFVPYSTAGHVHPVLPVMAELVARGVTVRALVGAAFAGTVAGAGAEVVPLTEVPDVHVPEWFNGPAVVRYLTDRARRPALHARAARSLAAELRRRPPDLAVVDPALGWADRLLRRGPVPVAVFATTFVRRPAGGRLVLVNAAPEMQPDAARLGVHPVGPLLRQGTDTEPWPVPARRLLYVSPGTVFARGPAYFRAIVAACADDWDIVLATGDLDPAALGPLPPGVVAHRRVPQLAVLDRAAVFLTHGGMNSALEALAAGIPMALAPRSREQRATARRLEALGVGVRVDVRDVDRLRRVIDGLAASAVAGSWRERLADTCGPVRATDLLLSAARATTSVASARRRSSGQPESAGRSRLPPQ